jgi:hypothetical protein
LTEVGTGSLLEPPSLDTALSVQFSSASMTGESPTERIELIGLTGPRLGFSGGTGLTLYWRAPQPIETVYHVRLRLVDGGGQVWWQNKGGHPANNYYPTSAWRAGEVVSDYHEIPGLEFGPMVSDRDFYLEVALLRPFSDEGLTVAREPWYRVTLPSLAIPTATGTSSDPLRIRFDEGGSATAALPVVVGVDLPDAVVAAVPFDLQLHWSDTERDTANLAWSAVNEGAAQWLPGFRWVRPDGESAAAQVQEAWGWSRFALQAPVEPGEYTLWMGMVDGDGGEVSVRCGWLGQRRYQCPLVDVKVQPVGASALANFDGKMLLMDAKIELPLTAVGVLPGESVAVELEWQGLRQMGQDFTVSVQLIGPDGKLHGQMDAWPLQGTLPTSQWTPGESFSDPYHVELSPDAPAGRYRVGVVVYHLPTDTRLSVLNAAGQATGDIVWVGELEVLQK